MSQTAFVWLVIVLAFAAANVPFLTERLFGVVRLARPKHAGIHLAELLVLYLLVGGIGLAFEQAVGRIAPQGWEFYAVTGSLFLTFAFPGFIWRYLAKRR